VVFSRLSEAGWERKRGACLFVQTHLLEESLRLGHTGPCIQERESTPFIEREQQQEECCQEPHAWRAVFYPHFTMGFCETAIGAS